MGKKTHRECREEHGSAGCCHEHLPSAAPHDMAGWQRASQSFHVSQIQGPYSRLELFDLGWIRKMEKEGSFSPSLCQALFITWTLLLCIIKSG